MPRRKVVVEQPRLFDLRDGTSVEEIHKRNSVNFMRSVWDRVSKGDDRLTEIMLTNLLKGVTSEVDNPLLGLPELKDVSLERLRELSEELDVSE